MNTAKSPQIAYLDQALWKRFNDPAIERNDFAKVWLALQCSMITSNQRGYSITRGCVVFKEQEKFSPAAYWPEATQPTPGMSAAAELAIREQRGVVYKPNEQTESHPQEVPIAFPFVVDGSLAGIVVLEVIAQSNAEVGAAMRQLQWGLASLENYCRRLQAPKSSHLVTALELTAAGLDAKNDLSAAFSMATEMATALACESVTIGFKKSGVKKGSNIQVTALSHNARFDKRSNRIRALEHAMDEALDQKHLISFPSSDNQLQITSAHEALLAITGSQSICTIPLIDKGEFIGAISIEHLDKDFFDATKIALCQRLTFALAPILELKRLEARWIGEKIADAVAAPIKKLIGPRHYAMKLATLALVGIIALMSIAVGEHRVSAAATLEGWQQRHIPAAIDGYIAQSYVKAGDVVKAGQPLFDLDDRELQLEKIKWSNQKEQLQKKYLDAFAQRDLAQVGVLEAQTLQAAAQLDLINEQLKRTRAVAPFEGVIVAGDLTQRLGSPVKRGESLMQIAPLDNYRIILAVGENDITQLQLGQQGVINLSALPDQTFPFTIKQITPVAEEKEGVNSFLVEAHLDEGALNLRPGMQGTGKISIGQRKLLWIWTHSLVDWLNVTIWRWWK